MDNYNQPPPILNLQGVRAFKNQSNIVWIQEVIGLIYHAWYYFQNLYFQSLSENIISQIWILSLIRKLCDTDCGIWRYRNHTVNATYGPTKPDILS